MNTVLFSIEVITMISNLCNLFCNLHGLSRGHVWFGSIWNLEPVMESIVLNFGNSRALGGHLVDYTLHLIQFLGCILASEDTYHRKAAVNT